jgi:hypothetical protein
MLVVLIVELICHDLSKTVPFNQAKTTDLASSAFCLILTLGLTNVLKIG